MSATTTDQLRFLTMLASLPLVRADAIVLLTGDGVTRCDTALELLARQAAPTLLVSGGVNAPPYAVDAQTVRRHLIERGVNPSILLEPEMDSTNTRASAVNVCAIATLYKWRSILLVTSAYHMPRAVLSFVAAMQAQGAFLPIIPVAVSQPWYDATDRLALLDGEFAKIDEYQSRGDVASYADGIAYLKRMECGE